MRKKRAPQPDLTAFRECLRRVDALKLESIVVEPVPRWRSVALELELRQAALLVNLMPAVLATLVAVRPFSKARAMVQVSDLRALAASACGRSDGTVKLPAEVAAAIRAGAVFNAALDAVLPADRRGLRDVPPIIAIGEDLRSRVPEWSEPHERRASALLRLAGFGVASFAGVDAFPDTTRRALQRLRSLLAITR